VRQGESGLGLEAQRATVEAFARQHGGAIVASFVEVETGKRSDRPELVKALEAARKGKATLLIAKLDRLARNVAFIANLMDAGGPHDEIRGREDEAHAGVWIYFCDAWTIALRRSRAPSANGNEHCDDLASGVTSPGHYEPASLVTLGQHKGAV
jgi:hypothetical protein